MPNQNMDVCMRLHHRHFFISPFLRLAIGSVVGTAASIAVPVLAQSSLPTLTNSPAHYISECKTFIAQKLYEPALFSCYNAYQLGSIDMGAVLYQLGKNRFFDEVTSSNLIQEYKTHQGSPEIQPLLMSIKFASQSNYIAQGSIYGSWCLDENNNLDPDFEGLSFEGYARLVINPTGEYIQASSKIENGNFQYRNNTLYLGHPNFGQYQVAKLDNNQLILKTESVESKQLEKTQTYSRKSCTKLGLQRFIQVLVNNKISKNCDEIINYLGPQLIPTQYLPTAIVNTLKQDPKRYHCPELIQKMLIRTKPSERA